MSGGEFNKEDQEFAQSCYSKALSMKKLEEAGLGVLMFQPRTRIWSFGVGHWACKCICLLSASYISLPLIESVSMSYNTLT